MTKVASLLLALLIFCAHAVSGEHPEDYPDSPMIKGDIIGLNRSAGGAVIADQLYLLSPTTRVTTSGGRLGSVADLAAGQYVGCDFVIDERQRFVLTQVWILPKGADLKGQVGGQGGGIGR